MRRLSKRTYSRAERAENICSPSILPRAKSETKYWKQLYQAALAETDSARRLACIAGPEPDHYRKAMTAGDTLAVGSSEYQTHAITSLRGLD